MDGRNRYGFRLFGSKTFSKQSNQTGSFASYWIRTHINSFDGYYATTASSMLLNSDMEGEQQAFKTFCNKYHCKISVNTVGSASYGNRTHVKNLKGYYTTSSSTMLVNSYVKKKNRGIDNSSLSNSDEKSSLSLKNLLRTRIEPSSIAWKVTLLPLHQWCWSNKIWTVESISDLNPLKQSFREKC